MPRITSAHMPFFLVSSRSDIPFSRIFYIKSNSISNLPHWTIGRILKDFFLPLYTCIVLNAKTLFTLSAISLSDMLPVQIKPISLNLSIIMVSKS